MGTGCRDRAHQVPDSRARPVGWLQTPRAARQMASGRPVALARALRVRRRSPHRLLLPGVAAQAGSAPRRRSRAKACWGRSMSRDSVFSERRRRSADRSRCWSRAGDSEQRPKSAEPRHIERRQAFGHPRGDGRRPWRTQIAGPQRDKKSPWPAAAGSRAPESTARRADEEPEAAPRAPPGPRGRSETHGERPTVREVARAESSPAGVLFRSRRRSCSITCEARRRAALRRADSRRRASSSAFGAQRARGRCRRAGTPEGPSLAARPRRNRARGFLFGFVEE